MVIWSSNSSSQMQSALEDKKNPSLVRLVEDKNIKKTIEVDEISIPTESMSGNILNEEKAYNTAGSEYPIIRVNDVVIPRRNISKFTLSSIGFLPTVSVKFSFLESSFVHKNIPKDGDILSVYLRAAQNNGLSYIRCDFLITSAYSKISSGDGASSVSIDGTLFIPGFFSKKNIIGYIGTSKEVMKKIAKDFGIGFAYNDFDDTDDFQNWLCCNSTIEEFVEEVLKHSWKNETSFFNAWIDPYYNLCFVNVNKFLLSNENEEDIDVTFATNTMNLTVAKDDTDTISNERLALKMLSNMSRMRGTPFYIEKWYPTNSAGNVSMDKGYQINSKAYIHNAYKYSDNSDECFEDLFNIPAYDQNKKDTYMTLRGRAKFDKDKNPDGEMERVNYDFVDTYVSNIWCGVEYVIDKDAKGTTSTDSWSGNVHKNYLRAVCHNEINMDALSKMYITVCCEGLCLQIMRGERVPVYIAFESTADYSSNNQSETDEERSGSRLYSGYYIVDSIEYSYSPKETVYSNFTTTFVLKRREWPTPEII